MRFACLKRLAWAPAALLAACACAGCPKLNRGDGPSTDPLFMVTDRVADRTEIDETPQAGSGWKPTATSARAEHDNVESQNEEPSDSASRAR